MRLPDDRVPPVLDVIVCAAGHVLFRNLGPLRSHLLYTIPDLLVFFRRPLAFEQLRSQMVAPPFPALLAVSIPEASSDRRPALDAVLTDELLEVLILVGAPWPTLGRRIVFW